MSKHWELYNEQIGSIVDVDIDVDSSKNLYKFQAFITKFKLLQLFFVHMKEIHIL
jgi:hypothetical protein